jgi:anti-sigma regulatory factor (Ser/Thr protein kinase)
MSVDARLENLAAIRAFIEEACGKAGADERTCFDLKLAVDEACTNVIEHGYAGQSGGPLGVSFESGAEGLRVTILDRGRAFSPETLPPPDLESDWTRRGVGGLGWHLIRASVDDVDYGPGPDGGNRLVLVKRSPRR